MNFESGWAGYAAQHIGPTLSAWPGIALVEVGRIFLNPDFAQWSGQDGHFHWAGKWEGLPSLYNHTTLGLPWVCLTLTILLWIANPARRQAALWIMATFIATLVALSGIFASFVGLIGLDDSIQYTVEGCAGRYLVPLLMAWFVTMIVLSFHEPQAQPENSI